MNGIRDLQKITNQRTRLKKKRGGGRTYRFPGVYLLVSVDVRDVSQAGGVRVDCGGFGDEQGTRGAGPLGVILKGESPMDVIFVCPEPCHWTENDTVLEVHATNTDRLKEFRRGHSESCKI